MNRNLVEIENKIGTWETSWDGRLADGRPAVSGVYFLRLDLGGNHHTVRAVLTP